MYARPQPKLYESDGWYVVESHEYVPPGRYEVRNPAGRQFGIWDSVERAIEYLHECKDRPSDGTIWDDLASIGITV
jgi:hypothetical protein